VGRSTSRTRVLKITNSSPAEVLIGNVSEPAPPFTIFRVQVNSHSHPANPPQ